MKNLHPDECCCEQCFDVHARRALETMDPGWLARNEKIIEVTPEVERRILEERRREPREHIADMERRLYAIASIIRSVDNKPERLNLQAILELAKGTK